MKSIVFVDNRNNETLIPDIGTFELERRCNEEITWADENNLKFVSAQLTTVIDDKFRRMPLHTVMLVFDEMSKEELEEIYGSSED